MEATKEDFWELAWSQRGKPEQAMRDFQYLMGGGIMNSTIEHVGDLTHRMAEKNTFPYAGYQYVKEKVDKTLNWLTNPYGFEREFEENIKSNAKYFEKDEDEYRKQIYAALENYAQEHEKLVTHNKAQEIAKSAAVNLGRKQYASTIRLLKILLKHLDTRENWIKFAHENLND